MGFQVSPGAVNVSEIDLTTIVPAVATTSSLLVALDGDQSVSVFWSIVLTVSERFSDHPTITH